MDEPVAVVTPFPVLRRGLFAALSGAAFAPEEPDDPLAWVAVDGHRAVLLAVDKRRDAQLVVDLRRGREDLVVVALLLEPTPDTVRGVLMAGACSVAGWDASPEEVVALLEAGLEERSVLPTSLIHQLAMGTTDEPGVPELARDQVAWLRALAAGVTVSQLADRVGYSEREMYRLLRGVYDRLGVASRTQALLWATRRGILD